MTKKIDYTVFLIKEEYTDYDDVLEGDEYIEKRELRTNDELEGYVYIGHNNESEPKWYDVIKSNIHDPPDINNKSTRAVMLVKVNGRMLAFTFGHGRFMIRKESYVRDFGLKVVLNNCEVSKLQSMDTLKLDNVTAQTRTQTSKASEISAFNIDNSRELLNGLRAEASDTMRYSKSISGKDAFNFTGLFKPYRLMDYCNNLLEDYASEKYKENFDWIDQISEVKDPDVLQELNKLLIEQLNQVIESSSNPYVHLSPTVILDLEKQVNFAYTEKGTKFDELNLFEYIKMKKIKLFPSIKKLKTDRVYVFDNVEDNYIEKWSIYDTLNTEIIYLDTLYILALGKWYAVDQDYLKEINKKIEEVETCPLSLIPYNHTDENDYNESVASGSTNIISMDRANINVDNGRFEFCDLLSDKQHLIHVKRWNSSSSLSHLFSQGRVSASTVLNMPQEIPKINQKIEEKGGSAHYMLSEGSGEVRNYTVVYAIIYKGDKEIHERLPFFSKINFVHSINTLREMQFNVQKIQIKSVA